jgi:hypothetical protein
LFCFSFYIEEASQFQFVMKLPREGSNYCQVFRNSVTSVDVQYEEVINQGAGIFVYLS